MAESENEGEKICLEKYMRQSFIGLLLMGDSLYVLGINLDTHGGENLLGCSPRVATWCRKPDDFPCLRHIPEIVPYRCVIVQSEKRGNVINALGLDSVFFYFRVTLIIVIIT